MSSELLVPLLVAAAVLAGGAHRAAARRSGRAGAPAPSGRTASGRAVAPGRSSGAVLVRRWLRWRAAASEPPSVRGTADVARAAAQLAALLRAGLPAAAAWQHLALVAARRGAAPGTDGGAGPPTGPGEEATVRPGGEASAGALVAAVERAALAARTGGDVAAALRGTGPDGPAPGALRTAARDEPVHRALASVAAAWQVAERSGAPPAEVLERLSAGLSADRDSALARESALAAPRSTSVVLLVLPLAGLGLGVLLGVDPGAVLLGTAAGRVCLVVGAAGTAGGWWWTRRLVALAERTP